MAVRTVVVLFLLATAAGAHGAWHRKLQQPVDAAVGVTGAYGVNAGNNKTRSGTLQSSNVIGQGSVDQTASAVTPADGKIGAGIAVNAAYAISTPNGKGGKINIAGTQSFAAGNNGGTYSVDTKATAGGASASDTTTYDGSQSSIAGNSISPVQKQGVPFKGSGTNSVPITIGGTSGTNTMPVQDVSAAATEAGLAQSSTANNLAALTQTGSSASASGSQGSTGGIILLGKAGKHTAGGSESGSIGSSSGSSSGSSAGTSSGSITLAGHKGKAADLRAKWLAALALFQLKTAGGE